MKRHCIYLFFLLFFSQGLRSDEIVPRVVIVMYNASLVRDVIFLDTHQLAEMPLNHLGIVLRYHKINKGYPDISNDPEVLGILSWFTNDQSVTNPHEYIEWAEKSVKAGKKFVMMGSLGFSPEKYGLATSEVNRLYGLLGLNTSQITVDDTYKVQIEIFNKKIMNFERTYAGFKPSYLVVQSITPEVQILAYAQHRANSSKNSIIAALSPNGGYVMEQYACHKSLEGPFMQGMRGWFINPFEFFRLAFAYDNMPVPDTTTLAGRRIYYSHVDGDGWNNLSQLEKYRLKKVLCAEAMYHEVFTRHKDLPVTVGPIGADIDLEWVAKVKSREIAEAIYSLPHIEVGCHTFTHPFDWLFFKHYKPSKEVPYLTLYPNGSWEYNGLTGAVISTFQSLRQKNTLGGDVSAVYLSDAAGQTLKPGALSVGYTVPRAYALQPFNVNLEVVGAIQEVNSLLKGRRKVKLMQWSGNCLVFEKVVKLSRDEGVRNINGGETRFDNEALSYAWVSAIGRQVGRQRQIYSSNANENIYTSGWTNRYWGQVLLQDTFKNTEIPLRVKPMNLYFHMFSAEKLASLSALFQNIEYIKSQPIVPITTSHFAAIADGFYKTKIITTGQEKWQILNRDELQTIRFDHASFKGLNFAESQGVVGQRHFQGSLYVYLDAAHENPLIVLKEIDYNDEEPLERVPYLIESHWPIWKVEQTAEIIKMQAQGFGLGEMKWRVPHEGLYKIQIKEAGGQKILEELEAEAKKGCLEFKTQNHVLGPVDITILRK